MSAYHVEPETFAKVMQAIDKVEACGSRYKEIAALKAQCRTDAPRLAVELVDLNRYSLIERYGDFGREQFMQINPVAVSETSQCRDYKPAELLKSLNCYLYQACEGRAEKTELYKTIEAVSQNVAMKIATDTPEYEALEWA